MPELNASLNLISAILLILGYVFVRQRAIAKHKICMLGATATSTIFLFCYIYYHLHHGATRFSGRGWIRNVYFLILISHTILAVVQVPLIFLTLRHALGNHLEAHKRLARITWPIWVYVSVTGVVIYFILYRINFT